MNASSAPAKPPFASLRALSMQALPVAQLIPSIVDPKTTLDNAVYDYYVAGVAATPSVARTIAPSKLFELEGALVAIRAECVQRYPTRASERMKHEARTDVIYAGLVESFMRYDNYVLGEDTKLTSMPWSMRVWHKAVRFGFWLVHNLFGIGVGHQTAVAERYAQQSRVYLPLATLTHVEKMRFNLTLPFYLDSAG